MATPAWRAANASSDSRSVAQLGQQQRRARALQHERVGEIVDIFRSAGKMHPFQLRRGRAAVLQFAAQPIFHGFDIVIGARLDLLDGRDIGCAGIFGQRREQLPGADRQAGKCSAPQVPMPAAETKRIPPAPVRASVRLR